MNKLTCFILLTIFFVSCNTNTSSEKVLPEKPIVSKSTPAPTQTSIYQHLVRQPIVRSENPPVLFLLHGFGSNEKDLFKFAQHLDDRLMVICPRAPKTMGDNRFSWFDLQRTPDGIKHDEQATLPASAELMQFINQMHSQYQFDKDNVFIGGFSQGAILTLGTGLLNPQKIKGVVCLSGQLYPEFIAAAQKEKVKDLNIFLSHGKQDQVLPFARIQQDVDKLSKIGVVPDVHYYEAKHTITQENLRDMMKWLSEKI